MGLKACPYRAFYSQQVGKDGLMNTKYLSVRCLIMLELEKCEASIHKVYRQGRRRTDPNAGIVHTHTRMNISL